MITAFALWLEAHYNKDYSEIYVGTVIIDIVGMASTLGVVRAVIS